jgi:hypothetical protein
MWGNVALGPRSPALQSAAAQGRVQPGVGQPTLHACVNSCTSDQPTFNRTFAPACFLDSMQMHHNVTPHSCQVLILAVITYPSIVAIFEHMVTPVRPIIEPLPCLNPWPVFNLHRNACLHRTT